MKNKFDACRHSRMGKCSLSYCPRSDFRGFLRGLSTPYRTKLQLKIRLALMFAQKSFKSFWRNFIVKQPLWSISRPAPVLPYVGLANKKTEDGIQGMGAGCSLYGIKRAEETWRDASSNCLQLNELSETIWTQYWGGWWTRKIMLCKQEKRNES